MEKKILHVAVIQSVLFLGCCILLAFVLHGQLKSTIQANVSENDSKVETLEAILANCSNYVKIEKSHSDLGNISVESDVLKKKIIIKYRTLQPINFSSIDKGTMIKSQYLQYSGESGEYVCTIKYLLEAMYEVKVRQDSQFIYVAFYQTRTMYDTIVVLDPGHGGIDSGTLAINKKYSEKEFNLSVAKKIKDKLEENQSIKVYMTRENDEYLTPQQRVKIINELKPDWCISIHCNSADNLAASGVEALYGSLNTDDSKRLAKACVNGVIANTNQAERGLIYGDSIYITRNVEAPIALVEIGFLSNEQEFKYLSEQDNLEKIADGIVTGILDVER